MITKLRNCSFISDNGLFIGRMDSKGKCYENPIVKPIPIESFFSLSKYKGCGIWTDLSDNRFKIYDVFVEGCDVDVVTNCGDKHFKIIKQIEKEDDNKLSCADLIRPEAVLITTSDGWNVLDMFKFKDIPFDMIGFNTYAYKDNEIKKCIITYDNYEIKYKIF